VHGDTDKVQFGMGTYGSRSGAVGMSAIAKALDKVEAKAKRIAAHLMEAPRATSRSLDGEVRVAGHRQEARLARGVPGGLTPRTICRRTWSPA
jgi:CO/xanthine dehydrogenase Mo-binding subunit